MPEFQRSKNTDYIYNILTSDKITKMSGGRIPKMTPEQAAGMLGSWVVETGDPTLTDLDVVEKVAGAGRGLSQYTGVRRIPYDRARADAIAQGIDPASAEWQMQYFADEYSGKFDDSARNMINWTRNFERAPAGLTPEQYAEYYTGSAASGKGYFRPGEPHTDRRMLAAKQAYQVYSALGGQQAAEVPLHAGEVHQLRQAPAGNQLQVPTQASTPPFGQKATLNGKPVVWGGDDYGWQSPGSFATIEQQQRANKNPFRNAPQQQQQNPLAIVQQGVRNFLGIK